jgi:galactose mutarotase-like enzyme
MGELWCVPWSSEMVAGVEEASIVAHGFGTISAARLERRLSLRGDEPVVRVAYRVENLDVRPLHFTWGIHPAFAVTSAHRIDHPGQSMPDGWLALTDTAARRGVAVVFDRSVFPHAWLWQVYGGWRGHHHVALEPWTSHPMELSAAQASGRARVLQPGESLETWAAFVVYGGLDAVRDVRREGEGFAVS